MALSSGMRATQARGPSLPGGNDAVSITAERMASNILRVEMPGFFAEYANNFTPVFAAIIGLNSGLGLLHSLGGMGEGLCEMSTLSIFLWSPSWMVITRSSYEALSSTWGILPRRWIKNPPTDSKSPFGS